MTPPPRYGKRKKGYGFSLSPSRGASGPVILSAAGAKDLLVSAAGAKDLLASAAGAKDLLASAAGAKDPLIYRLR